MRILPFWYTDGKGTNEKFPRGPRPASPSIILPGMSVLRTSPLHERNTPMSSENPQRLPLPRAQTEDGLDTTKCPLSHMSPCPALLHHQEINAGTRNDLPHICSLQTRAHSVIHRTQLIQLIQLIQPSLGLSSFGDGWRMLKRRAPHQPQGAINRALRTVCFRGTFNAQTWVGNLIDAKVDQR